MRILREHSIGLVIDMQERLVPAMEEHEQLVENCRKLIRGMELLKLPFLLTQQYSKGLGETIPEIKEVITDFQYIEKKDFSCMDEPSFVKKLDQSGAQNVIICGIEAHVCVMQTAIDLREAGYNPVVIMDCVSSRAYDNVDLAAERFRHEKIIMTSYESILFELTRSANAPEFKEISKLVK